VKESDNSIYSSGLFALQPSRLFTAFRNICMRTSMSNY